MPLTVASRKGRALIAFLATQPCYRASREHLSTLLWGDSGDVQARQSLRQCIATLRRDLYRVPDLLIVDRDSVALQGQDLIVDACEFAILGKSTQDSDLARAAALLRGEFLVDLSIDVEEFDAWRRREGTRLAEAAARVFETLSRNADQRHDRDAAIAAAERLVAIEPTREDWQRMALRLSARYEGREAALSRAKKCIDVLKHELGVAPEAETLALVEAIKRGEIETASPATMQDLPPAGGSVATAGDERPVALRERSPTAKAWTVLAEAARVPSGGRWALLRHSPKWSAAALAGIAAAIPLGVLAPLRPADRMIPAQSTAAPGSRTLDQESVAYEPSEPPVIEPVAPLDAAALAAKGFYSIMVLPFTGGTARGQPDQELAGQITDDLINDLSRGGALRVVTRQTSRLYQGRSIDVAAIGAELGVRYVVVGSVRSEGTALEVNVELVDASTRLQAWTGRVVRGKAERRAAVSEIAWGITRQLHVEVVMAEDRRSSGDSSQNTKIGELLAKGWSVIFRHNVTGTTAAAEDYFAQVLQREPENVSATIGLAAHYVISVANLYTRDREPYLSRADALLAKAIDKQPHSSQAYYFLGILQKTRDQPDAALRSFTIALELSPSNAPAAAQIGAMLAVLGRANEAIEYIHRAINLSPKDPALGRWYMFGGQIELELRHDEEAVEWLLRAIALNPRNVRAHALLGAAYALLGNKADAARQVAEVQKLAPWAVDHTDKIFGDGSMTRSDGHFPAYVQGWQIAVATTSR
jgi:DNA-binding SARP family transcriptional activator/TolB-like protein/cytochrome c-type biogenesis protein CcmH/NrfG